MINQYIKALCTPTAKKATVRRVWSVDLQAVWLPFFTATNVMGDTAVPIDALGCPIRLAYNKDGSVRFTDSGRPVTRVAKELSQHVTMVRDNFVANLLDYASQVAHDKKDAYSNMVTASIKSGQPILQRDNEELDKAIKLQIEAQLAEAEAKAQAESAETTPTPADKEKVLA